MSQKVAEREGRCFHNQLTTITDLGDNIWSGPNDEVFWFDGISWLDEDDSEWVLAGDGE